MGNISVEVITLFDRTAEISAAMEKRLEQVSDQSANDIASRASALAPRRTGEEAGDFEVTGSGSERHVINQAPYFPYVELGTRKMAAEPSLTPAAQEEAPHFAEDLRKAVEEVTAL